MDILVVDGKAHEIFDGHAPELHPSSVIVKDYTGDVECGWLWNGSTFSEPSIEVENIDDYSTVVTRRNKDLADSDWIVIKSLEEGVAIPEEWKAYRQALRDLTQAPGWPEPGSWPVKPAS